MIDPANRIALLEDHRRELGDILARSVARLLAVMAATVENTKAAHAAHHELVKECLAQMRGSLADYLKTK